MSFSKIILKKMSEYPWALPSGITGGLTGTLVTFRQ